MNRICPAHVPEAKQMANDLVEALEQIGITSNCRDPDASFLNPEQAKDFLAKSMGYEDGWEELVSVLQSPHEPVYIDGDISNGNQLLEGMVNNMSKLLGFDYAHGFVLNAIQMAGVGYTPTTRRLFNELESPWGLIVEQELIAEGISSVKTGSHGGIILSDDRQSSMPLHLRLDAPYYEEDCDWALVALAFPKYFQEQVKWALSSVDVYRSSSVPQVREPADSD